jgi:hypothetical protein
MWPPVAPKDVTIEMVFCAWKDHILIKKALNEWNDWNE